VAATALTLGFRLASLGARNLSRVEGLDLLLPGGDREGARPMMIEIGRFEGVLPPALALVVGIVLLVAGRRVFWLAVGAAGFVFALVLALRWLDARPFWLLLGLAFLAGVVGAMLAVLLQRLAVAVAGFLVGGWAGLALWFLLGGVEGFGALLAFLVAGVVAAILAGALFEAALIVVSALIGAVLVAGAAGAEGPFGMLLIVVLAVAGALIQTAFGRRRRSVE
jgi:hypothetical protein